MSAQAVNVLAASMSQRLGALAAVLEAELA